MNKKKTTTSKKPTKKSVKAKTPQKSSRKVVPQMHKQSLIEVMPDLPIHSHLNQKMDFDDVYMVFDALYNAFHNPNLHNHSEDGVNNQFIALWTLFLMTANWSEDEFWDTLDGEHTCEDCKREQEEAKKIKASSEETSEEIPVVPAKVLPPGKQFN